MQLTEIASRLGLSVEGDGSVEVRAVASLEDAGPGDVTFCASAKHAARAAATKASAILVGKGLSAGALPALRTTGDVMLAVADLIALLHPRPRPTPGIHPTAVVAPTARIGPGASIAPYVVIEDGVEIGRNAEIGPHVVIRRGSRIGDDALIHSHVTIREGTRIGHRVVLQDGAILGGDGFGFAHRPDGTHKKLPHVGHLELGDDVELQAGTCADRGTMGATRIGNGVKTDNLVQIGHNVQIGDDSLLCGGVMLGGSTITGKGCVFGGQVGSAGHQKIGDRVMFSAQSGLGGDYPAGKNYGGSPAIDQHDWLRYVNALPKLPALLRDVRALVARVEALEKGEAAPPA